VCAEADLEHRFDRSEVVLRSASSTSQYFRLHTGSISGCALYIELDCTTHEQWTNADYYMLAEFVPCFCWLPGQLIACAGRPGYVKFVTNLMLKAAVPAAGRGLAFGRRLRIDLSEIRSLRLQDKMTASWLDWTEDTFPSPCRACILPVQFV
jgi:hypothetical protein